MRNGTVFLVMLLGALAPVWSAGPNATPNDMTLATVLLRLQITVGAGGAPAPQDLEALYQYWRVPYARPDLGMPPAPLPPK